LRTTLYLINLKMTKKLTDCKFTDCFTVSMVFLSITKMPNTLNPIGSFFKRFKNTIIYNMYLTTITQ